MGKGTRTPQAGAGGEAVEQAEPTEVPEEGALPLAVAADRVDVGGEKSYLPGYVVSVTSKVRRLHHTSLCHLRPHLDFRYFEEYGNDVPPAEAYSKVCRKCWPAHGQAGSGASSSGVPAPPEPEEDSDEDETTSSTSSS